MFDSLPRPYLPHPVGPRALEGASGQTWAPAFRRGPASALCKRVTDVVLAGAALLLLLPAFVLIALAITLDSEGPILFRQRRTGRGGQVFTILKFRSMTVAEDGDTIVHAVVNDRRVTRVGAVIRATSLDELPQLINVVLGDMSLVGPRPHALAHDLQYGALLPRYVERFAVRPGLTGAAQILGLRGEIRRLNCMARRVEADVAYAAGWSFRDDMRIMWRTVPILLSRVNAC